MMELGVTYWSYSSTIGWEGGGGSVMEGTVTQSQVAIQEYVFM